MLGLMSQPRRHIGRHKLAARPRLFPCGPERTTAQSVQSRALATYSCSAFNLCFTAPLKFSVHLRKQPTVEHGTWPPTSVGHCVPDRIVSTPSNGA